MTSVLEQLNHWHWFIIGIALIVLEVFLPSTFFLWLGVSAGIVGIIVWIVPALAWENQFIIFSLLSVINIVAWRLYLKKNPIKTDHPVLNRRGEQYIGRFFTLDEAIVNRVGKIKVDDTTWKVTGEDLPIGAKVKITGVDGTVLTVAEE